MSFFPIDDVQMVGFMYFCAEYSKNLKKSYEKKNSVDACCHPDYLQH